MLKGQNLVVLRVKGGKLNQTKQVPKILLLFAMVLVLSIAINALTLSTSPTAISFDYVIGDSQPAQKTITFTRTSELNRTDVVSLNKSGEGITFYNISATSITFEVNQTEKALQVNFGIPQDADTKVYSSNINYNENSIPVLINVKAKTATTTGCKILLPSELFQNSIKKGVSPFTEEFVLKVSNKCENGITITDTRESGQVTQTEQGKQPIRLTGAVPKGDYDKGESIPLKVEFDVSLLNLGDYRASIVLTSTEGDEQLTQKMDFRIFVVGTASAVTNSTFSTPPTCNLQTGDMQIGKTYQLICNNVVSSDFQLNIVDDVLEFIKGISREEPPNQLIWTFTPIKLGNTKFKSYFTFKGSPIGEVQEYDLRISQVATGELGTKLKFDFFPKSLDMDNLKAGDKFNVLVKAVNPDAANDSGTIINDYVLYKDAVPVDTNEFTVSGGEEFTLLASAVGFGSIERIIKTPLDTISLSFPSDIEIGQNITFSTSPEDAEVYLDNILIPKAYSFNAVGAYSLAVKREGYKDTLYTVQVTEPLRLLSEIPKKIKIADEVIIEFNKGVDWEVRYKSNKKNETQFTQFSAGGSNPINFIPSEKGVYEVYARGQKIAEYDLTGISLNWGIIRILLVLAVIGVVWFYGSQQGWWTKTQKPKKSAGTERVVSPFELSPPNSG